MTSISRIVLFLLTSRTTSFFFYRLYKAGCVAFDLFDDVPSFCSCLLAFFNIHVFAYKIPLQRFCRVSIDTCVTVFLVMSLSFFTSHSV
jgi:hypothetical protein